jgi:hypothetical protein
MRRGRKGGLCALCGIESDGGLYWESAYVLLDFGIPGVPPIEPGMTRPVLCDNCHQLESVVSAYREDTAFAQHIYGARTPADALRLMGWAPSESLTQALAGRKNRKST